MYVIHDLAGRFWNGTAFSSYYKNSAKRFSSQSDAEIKAGELNALVDTTEQDTLQPLVRLYHLVAVNNKTEAETLMTLAPMTHEECCVNKSKLTVHAERRIVISETEYQAVYVEDLSGVALDWAVAIITKKQIRIGLSQGEKAVFQLKGDNWSVYKPTSNLAQAILAFDGLGIELHEHDPVSPKATYSPDKDNPMYFYRLYGDTVFIAALKCLVRIHGGNDQVLIPKWLLT